MTPFLQFMCVRLDKLVPVILTDGLSLLGKGYFRKNKMLLF